MIISIFPGAYAWCPCEVRLFPGGLGMYVRPLEKIANGPVWVDCGVKCPKFRPAADKFIDV